MKGKNKLPGKWADFLRDATNKQEMFGFIFNKVASVHCPENKEMFIKLGSTAIIRGSNRSMGPCNHEEADTRLIVHSILNGCYNSLVCTVDTDVVVIIIIGKLHHLHVQSLCPNVTIWIAFKTFPTTALIHRMNIWEVRNR